MRAVERVSVAALLLFVVQLSIASDVKLPDTLAGQQFSAWLAGFNSGDRPKIEGLTKLFKDASARDPGRDMQMRQMTGGFKLRQIEESTPTRLTGLVQEASSERFAHFVIEVEPNPPHLITTLALRLVPRPPEVALPAMTEKQTIDAAQGHIDELAARGEFSGTALIAKDGNVIWSQAAGVADREHKIPVRLDTRFNLGSMNKMFTAVGIAQLAEQGKLNFNDPMGKYLANYPNREAAAKVTIDELLTHTGGTGDIFGPEFEAHLATLKIPADYIALYGGRPFAFEPGSRWEYSNYGYVLLGAIIEKVSGEDYYQYVREHIDRPAGMTSSDSDWKTDSAPNYAIGYPGRRPPSRRHGHAAHARVSSGRRLLRFAQAFVGHRLLDEASTELVTTGKVAAPGGKYGYGFQDETEGGKRWFGHNGGAPGANAELRIYPASGYMVAVMANLDPPAAEQVADFIGMRLPAP